jgi:hypothetical protein
LSIEDILQSISGLSAKDLEDLLHKRQAEDKALRTLWIAALRKEREARRLQREVAHVN